MGPQVLVTGDVIIDHHLYMGSRGTHDSREMLGSLHQTTLGGAGLLCDAITAVSRQITANERKKLIDKRESLIKELGALAAGDQNDDFCQRFDSVHHDVTQLNAQLAAIPEKSPAFPVQFDLNVTVETALADHLHGYAIWKAFPANPQNEKEGLVWRIQTPLGYGSRRDPLPPLPLGLRGNGVNGAEILVIDDAGLGFRFDTTRQAWPKCLCDDGAPPPKWVVLKLSGPLGYGNLIECLQRRFADRLILIVSVDDIRREQATVSRGISWERTALDLQREIESDAALGPLKHCRHLIIPIRSEGALWVERIERGPPVYRLIFDLQFLEGEFETQCQGTVFGLTSCLTASVVQQLASQIDLPDLGKGVAAGLSGMRKMLLIGHGKITEQKPGGTFGEIAREILNPARTYAQVELPEPNTADEIGSRWSIIAAAARGDRVDRPLYGPATAVAILGDKALAHVPHLSCGKLTTVDREEIESLRIIHALVSDYLDHDSGKKPLSLAVFGPPGSGKSFAVKQLAASLPGRRTSILEFNLAQFAGPQDLIGALHQVRDEVLRGTTPFVFFDEFDSNAYKWLTFLLAPMQDGTFQDERATHPVGKCVFIFAGGTSRDMEHFGPRDLDEVGTAATDEDRQAAERFKLAKGPDFKSRLAGYLNVLGPNPREIPRHGSGQLEVDPHDACFPVRRALFLRGVLGVKGSERLEIDRGILAALLRIPRYEHGARSLERILLQMKQASGGPLRRSSLPSDRVLRLHVDPAAFRGLIEAHRSFHLDVDSLAPVIHGFYCQLNGRENDYERLGPEAKGDNRAAAARIPLVLELAGLTIEKTNPPTKTDPEIEPILTHHLELLAEAEHDGWMDHKLRNGWTLHEHRDDGLKRHPALRPYQQLSDQDKEKDRNSVRTYPDVLRTAGYRIIESGTGNSQPRSFGGTP
jgi:hypothetical protein